MDEQTTTKIDVPKPAERKPRREPEPVVTIFVDVVGPDDVPAHLQAPLAVTVAGSLLVLRPGLNPVPAPVWSAALGHAGVKERLPAPDSVEEPGPLAGDIRVLPAMPTSAAALVELAGRTFSLAGLEYIEQAELSVRDPMSGIVAAALTKQHAIMAKRAKPVKVEPARKPRRK
jgi:hypothetical protein